MAGALERLDPPARDLARTSLDWLERHRDRDSGLFRLPGEPAGRIRESAWWALGLLARDAGGDRARAARLLEAALDAQLDAPGERWHGSFRRTPREPAPGAGAREWIDYDPNWRQFLSAAFAQALRSFGHALPDSLARRLVRAIDRARRGEPADRVPASYTNIALMKAWLDAEAGDPAGMALARDVAVRFDAHGAFDEYGSPTYYGTDLCALALWRSHATSAELRALGARLEAALWRDVARFYHAGLRNLAGPYARAYGMDMTRYAAKLGLCVWAALGRENAPFPDPTQAFDHAHDFACAPLIALLGPRIPDDARSHFERFQGERRVERRLPGAPARTASAWLSEQVAVGAESSPVDWRGFVQHHPATIHWRAPDGGVAWLRVRHDGPVDARAETGALALRLAAPEDRAGRGTRVVIRAPGAAGCAPAHGRLALPGLCLRLEGDGLEAAAGPPAGADLLLLAAAPGPTQIRFIVEPDRAR